MKQQRFGRNCGILPLLLALSSFCSAQTPIIFDTDMGNDIDDALALAILHSLASRGECRLIGVTLTNASTSAVPYVQMINKFYGRAGLPIGSAVRRVNDGDHDDYMQAALRSAPASDRNSGASAGTESAVILLRRLLAGSRDKVTFVQVGFSTNLAMLLDSPPDSISPMTGLELVKSKVALLSAMAGNFADLKPEYNVRLDIPSARAVFERWPTPVIFSGFEIGRDLVYPSQSIERDFAYTDWHPIAVSYRAYKKMPYDRPTWDLTAALQAVRPSHHYFGLSAKGTIHVEADGTTRFEAGGGNRQFLLLDQSQRSRVLEALTLLTSEPPHEAPSGR